jgi:hypothetical protein
MMGELLPRDCRRPLLRLAAEWLVAVCASIAIVVFAPRTVAFGAGLAVMIAFVLRMGWVTNRLKLKGRDPRVQAVVMAFYMVGCGLLMAFTCVPTGLSIMPFAPLALMVGGQWLFLGLRHWRAGDSLHCPKCDYELGCAEADAPVRCPECGFSWLGRWAKGASRRSVPLAAVGAVIFLLATTPYIAQFTGMGGAAATALPNRALILLAATDPWGHNKGTWRELLARSLSQEETDRLAAKLLNLRRRTGYLYGDPAAWLEKAVLAGAVAPPHIDRYYSEWLEVRLVLPDSIQLGSEVPIRLAGEERRGGPTDWMYLLIDQVLVDGEPVPMLDETLGVWKFSLDFKDETGEKVNLGMFTGAAEGIHTVRVRAYRCVVPKGLMSPVQYSREAEPLPPPGAVHFAPVTLEKQLKVLR